MTSHRNVIVALFCAGALLACGGDDDSADEPAAGTTADAAANSADDTADDTAGETAEATADDVATGGGGGGGGGGAGTAVLELDNGERFEFSILCNLESQMAAGSEILFTVVSYDDIGLDITQFGDEGTITETASISVYNSDFETIWEAGSLYEIYGGTFSLDVDGSTVTGGGSFYPTGDPAADAVNGEVVANC